MCYFDYKIERQTKDFYFFLIKGALKTLLSEKVVVGELSVVKPT